MWSEPVKHEQMKEYVLQCTLDICAMFNWEHLSTFETPCLRERHKTVETTDRGCQLHGRFPAMKHSAKHQGTISRKARKLFGPAKPFLINLLLKTERCILLKLLVWRELLVMLRICQQSSFVIIRFEILLRFSGCENFSGASEKQVPRPSCSKGG